MIVFTDSWQERWVTSTHDGKTFGKFETTAGKFYADESNKGKGYVC